MFKQIKKAKEAGVTVEYMCLIIFLLAAFFAFQKYFMAGLMGRWRDVGDSFGFGSVYRPGITNRCAFDYLYYNVWYDLDCFENTCSCIPVTSNVQTCQNCITSCQRTYCN